MTLRNRAAGGGLLLVALSGQACAPDEGAVVLTFVEAGTVRGTAELDIGPMARPGARYTHVRLTQPGQRSPDSKHQNNAGPDVDAVGAIGAELP